MSDRSTARIPVRVVAVVVPLLLAAGVWAGWKLIPRDPPNVAGEHDHGAGGELAGAPRAAFESPFLNTKADVHYVGDAVCAKCHQEIAESFAKHPMGQSLAPIGKEVAIEDYEKGSFVADDLFYDVTRRDGQVFHRESRRDAEGNVLAERESPIRFVVGSGANGRSYVVERDGYLIQSPISWYVQKARWDLSPGYEDKNSHFERPITPECLYCHSNRFLEVEGPRNRYEEPIFDGHTVGCERCHGPGELHAANPGLENGIDRTIVNPKHLEPHLREGVCQQCHLSGRDRIVRAGREMFDYRPGLPLHEYWSIFVAAPGIPHDPKLVSQVEQMQTSRCYIGSGGTMGCISCHDPHHSPTESERVAWFRKKCLDCHQEKDCGVPYETRIETSEQDSCYECHMPRIGTEIAHTAVSDHRIMARQIDDDGRSRDPTGIEIPLVNFHLNLLDPADNAQARDLMMALAQQAPESLSTPTGQTLLVAAPQLAPNDAATFESLGVAFGLQRETQRGLGAAHRAIELSPGRESSLMMLGYLGQDLRDPDVALDGWEQAIAANPYVSAYHAGAARMHAMKESWQAAVESCDAALALEPTLDDLRRILITGLVKTGDRDRARAELDRLIKLRPDDEQMLENWFENL